MATLCVRPSRDGRGRLDLEPVQLAAGLETVSIEPGRLDDRLGQLQGRLTAARAATARVRTAVVQPIDFGSLGLVLLLAPFGVDQVRLLLRALAWPSAPRPDPAGTINQAHQARPAEDPAGRE